MTTRADCASRDADDPVRSLRDNFTLDDSVIYMDGNSLGPMARQSREHVLRALDTEWAQGLVGSWNTSQWMDSPMILGDRLAPLIGAQPGEVLIADTITMMLAKLVGASLNFQSGRHVVLTDETNFHSDLYILDGVARFANRNIEVRRIDRHLLEEYLSEDVALVEFSHVDFRTGEMLDLHEITARVHDVGALMLWDLAHSAGAVPVDVTSADVDLAVGCTYKFLNAGPGSPGFCYIRGSLQDRLDNPLPGWLGHARPFDFDPDYVAAAGIRAFQTSTPPIIAMAALKGSLDVFEQTTMSELRDKSLALSTLFMDLVEERLSDHDIEVVTPREPFRRGSHVSLQVEGAYGVVQALIERGVIGDFRALEIARFGLTPLTLRFVDVFDAVDQLVQVLDGGEHLDPRFDHRNQVT